MSRAAFRVPNITPTTRRPNVCFPAYNQCPLMALSGRSEHSGSGCAFHPWLTYRTLARRGRSSRGAQPIFSIKADTSLRRLALNIGQTRMISTASGRAMKAARIST